MTPGEGNLSDIRVIEIADEQGEYCGRVLAGLGADVIKVCLLYTSPSPRDQRGSRMPSSA